MMDQPIKYDTNNDLKYLNESDEEKKKREEQMSESTNSSSPEVIQYFTE